jgi:uncharacterized membrane protein
VPEDESATATSSPSEDASLLRKEFTGEDLGRILSLSDGVFAFALTLLALSLAVPTFDTTGLSNGEVSSHLAALLQKDWNAFFGYVFAFVMIGVWWVAHNRIFRCIARYDSRVIWINMAILLQIAVMPFVMNLYSHYSDTQVAVDLFAAIQVGLGVANAVLWDYLIAANLGKPGVSNRFASYFSRRVWLISAIFALSIGISFWSIDLAQYSWVLVFLAPRLFVRSPI